MKKILTLLVALLVAFAFVSCDNGTPAPENASAVEANEIFSAYMNFAMAVANPSSGANVAVDENTQTFTLKEDFSDTESGYVFKAGSMYVAQDGGAPKSANISYTLNGKPHTLVITSVDLEGYKMNVVYDDRPLVIDASAMAGSGN